MQDRNHFLDARPTFRFWHLTVSLAVVMETARLGFGTTCFDKLAVVGGGLITDDTGTAHKVSLWEGAETAASVRPTTFWHAVGHDDGAACFVFRSSVPA